MPPFILALSILFHTSILGLIGFCTIMAIRVSHEAWRDYRNGVWLDPLTDIYAIGLLTLGVATFSIAFACLAGWL